MRLSAASRFPQAADGYDLIMVAGVATRERGEDTGARPGRLMRSGTARWRLPHGTRRGNE